MDALNLPGSLTWECVLNDTDVPCKPRVLFETSAPLHSQRHLLEPDSLEGRSLQLWRDTAFPQHLLQAPSFSSFSSFSLHFNSVASQRFLFQTAERCISLTPLHTWFNFQLAWDAREIIWFFWLVGILDVLSFPPVPPAPAKLFRVGCQADTQVFSHPLPSLVLFYTICSQLKGLSCQKESLGNHSAPTSAASREVGSGLCGCRGSLSGGGFKTVGFLLKLWCSS